VQTNTFSELTLLLTSRAWAICIIRPQLSQLSILVSLGKETVTNCGTACSLPWIVAHSHFDFWKSKPKANRTQVAIAVANRNRSPLWPAKKNIPIICSRQNDGGDTLRFSLVHNGPSANTQPLSMIVHRLHFDHPCLRAIGLVPFDCDDMSTATISSTVTLNAYDSTTTITRTTFF